MVAAVPDERKGLLRGSSELVEFFLDAAVWHHFTADFAETAQPVGDGEESVLVAHGHVASHVPAVAQRIRGFLRTVQIALHYIGSANQQHAGLARGHRQGFAAFERLRIHNSHADPRQGMADVAALAAHLAKARAAEVGCVDGHYRGALRRAITFERAQAKCVFKRQRHALGQLFGAHQHVGEAAELFRRAAAYVSLQERRRGQ